MPKDTPRDSSRGHALFRDNCARCHGTNGQGIGVVPALWGAKSYSIGASMARVERAASFIRYNMPFDRPGSLTDQQAFDIAAYINSMTRPDLPGKENDWPQGGRAVRHALRNERPSRRLGAARDSARDAISPARSFHRRARSSTVVVDLDREAPTGGAKRRREER